MKVVPDAARIPSGYLYAFLSSEVGSALIKRGTFGSVIQSIEPRHIAQLPVPRIGDSQEAGVNSLVEHASRNLSDYQALINDATARIFKLTGIANPSRREWHQDSSDIGFVVNSAKLQSLRAWNASRRVQRLRDQIMEGSWSSLGSLVDEEWLKWRVMFKRIDVEPEHGIEVLTQRPLFHLFPEGRWISRAYLLNLSSRYVVPDETILIAKQGTLGEDELYCRCEYITGTRALSRAYSDHCMRVVVRKGAIDPGYLFAFLRSDAGFRMLRALSEGAKQQDIHWRTIPHLPVPRLSVDSELAIGEMVREAYARKNEAVDLILEARARIEAELEARG
jgi:type I restriction enzyme S subunit